MRWNVPVGVSVLSLAAFGACSSSPGSSSSSGDAAFGDGATPSDSGADAPFDGTTDSGADALVDTGTVTDASTGADTSPGNDGSAQDASNDAVSTLGCTAGFDPSFGTQGVVQRTTPPDPAPEIPLDIALQADGKILVSGLTTANASAVLVARYGTDGSPDTTFGTGGIATVTPATGSSGAGQILVQSDGKILGTGYVIDSTSQIHPYLFRLGTDGTLDSSFGTAGFAASPTTGAFFHNLLLRPSGAIVAMGGVNPQGLDIVAQYDSTGALDGTFGTGGFVTTALAGGNDLLTAVLQPDGMIVASGGSGYRDDAGTYRSVVQLVRYTTTGALDPAFGTAGITAPLDLGGGSYYVIGLARQSTGAIVAALYSSGMPTPSFYLVRFTSTGQLDASFGTNGVALATFPAAPTTALSITALAGDALLVTGEATGVSDAGSNRGLGLARFTANGAPDTTLGTGGTMLVPLPGAPVTQGTVLQPDQQIVVAATTIAPATTDGGSTRTLDLARFCP